MNMVRLALTIAMAASMTGCLTTSPQERSDWNVECTEAALRVAEKPKFGVARVALVEMRAPYAVREIAVLRSDGSIAFDPCNSYAASPVSLMKGVALESLSRSGLFSSVVGSGSSVAQDVDVEVAVTRLALDCRTEGHRDASVSLSLVLVGNRTVLASSSAEAAEPVEGGDYSAAFSRAFSRALSTAIGYIDLK